MVGAEKLQLWFSIYHVTKFTEAVGVFQDRGLRENVDNFC